MTEIEVTIKSGRYSDDAEIEVKCSSTYGATATKDVTRELLDQCNLIVSGWKRGWEVLEDE